MTASAKNADPNTVRYRKIPDTFDVSIVKNGQMW